VNSQGNAAYALVYRSDWKTILLRTDPNIFKATAEWAFSFDTKPWGVVFGKTED
jgi:hypothetical protein